MSTIKIKGESLFLKLKKRLNNRRKFRIGKHKVILKKYDLLGAHGIHLQVKIEGIEYELSLVYKDKRTRDIAFATYAIEGAERFVQDCKKSYSEWQ